MTGRYLAFDVETPNRYNNRMSALAVSVVEGGVVAPMFASLIDPQCPFEPFHMALTGITPEKVAGKPTFPQVWQQIRPLMESGLLVAHNAPFDMSVLAKCLKAYGIVWQPQVSYACTCQITRRLLPQLSDHKLDTLCRYWQIDLAHHQADSDSRACGEILLRCLLEDCPIDSFTRTYDMERVCTIPRRGI